MVSNASIHLNLQVIYLCEYMQVELDETTRFIYITWLKHTSSEKFREMYQVIAEITIEHKAEYCLSDARAIHYIEFADQNWIIQHMAPLLNTTSVKQFARLTNKESLTLMDAARVFTALENLPHVQSRTQFNVFTSKADAYTWLFPEIA
ncbi:hypothetical protein [uncultured Pontibacter sp.]|uniref:hypothetical protein n=1 Tax=uncultured Pontibacter sp. TaxID=453356 RepID=UPI00261A425E|nr:hypothetical protein [uncultured Pontibacter sp.]